MKSPRQSPLLLLVAGLPASGKTWFARAVATSLKASHLNSDKVRTALGLRGHYDPASKLKVYQSMFGQAEKALRQGESLVVDATFYKKSLRQPWIDLARQCRVPCFLIEIRIPEELALERLLVKRADSEATQEVYFQLKAQWENIVENHLVIQAANRSTEEMIAIAANFLFEEHNAIHAS
jgi:predicted kinase